MQHQDPLIESVVQQVSLNCNISDARYAGLHSICGLALRLRDLYKWEHRLEPWVEMDSSEILDWIGEKEESWEELSEKEFQEITILDHRYDPFDSEEINAVLKPYGLMYGAGYAYSLRPTFFLAVIQEVEEIFGHPVYVLGRELARDLLTLPAFSQGDAVLIRKESGRYSLWDRIFFLKKSGRNALRFALESFGMKDYDLKSIQSHLAGLFSVEMDSYIYHELGEIEDMVFDRTLWREIVATYPHSPIELLVRSVKDILADTNEHGTLRHILEGRKSVSLGLYVAFLDGLSKELFPEMREAFSEFVRSGDWKVIRIATEDGFQRAKNLAVEITRIFLKGKRREDMDWAKDEMERTLLAPLGLLHKGEDN
jgi:hypothetical protein